MTSTNIALCTRGFVPVREYLFRFPGGVEKRKKVFCPSLRLFIGGREVRMEAMKGNKGWVTVKVEDIIPVNKGMAVFLQAGKKLFVIQVDMGMGIAMGLSLMGKKNERPLTHDLMASLFVGFGIEMTHCVIVDMREETYHARLNLLQENELGKKIVELDARPSDCLVLSIMHQKPIYILPELLEVLEDVRPLYEELKRRRDDDKD